MRTVQLGDKKVIFPSVDLGQLQDCNYILDNVDALRQELKQKGYLFVRGLHDREEVLRARQAVLQYITSTGDNKILEPISDGKLYAKCGHGCIPFMEGRNPISHSEEVLKVIEGHRPKLFFKRLLGGECLTFDFKWLRGVHRHGFTGAHVDWVYMGRGTEELYTMWTPIGDCTVEMGTLAMCESSNCLPSFRALQDTYGNLDVEAANLEGTGWFTTDPFEISKTFGGQWKTSDFQAGDALIFTMRTVHMSTANLTDLVRISCDTRWQLQSLPVDERYMGTEISVAPKYGFQGKDEEEISNKTTMKKLKAKWGL